MQIDTEDHPTLLDYVREACGLIAIIGLIWTVALIAMHFSPEKLPV